MKFAVVNVPAAPIRRKAQHQSEMMNQLLFGEAVEIIKKKKKLWIKVRSLHDDYEGWMTDTLLTETTEEDARIHPDFLTSGQVNTIIFDNNKMTVPAGSVLRSWAGDHGLIGNRRFTVEGELQQRNAEPPGASRLLDTTSQWINAPYLWGGRTIFGVDCSGFVQMNYKMMGIDLPRDAWQQAGKGKTVKKLADAICGDLAFFDDSEEIVHVGLLLNNEKIIHASGRVRIDRIDKKGIINTDTGKRTHSLKVVKRIM
jgi:cell wall-associated NlpC family hydrolase